MPPSEPKYTLEANLTEPTNLVTHRPTIHSDGGPWVTHDMACPVFFENCRAVYDMDRRVFMPSDSARIQGWKLVRVKTSWQRFCFWLSGLDD